MNQNKALTFNDLKFLFALVAAVVTLVWFMASQFDNVNVKLATITANDNIIMSQHQVLFQDYADFTSSQADQNTEIAGLAAELRSKN